MTQPITKTTQSRPPIIVIMGHIDHGKTTLLDYIRKSTIAQKEAGGITQHIGAYQTTYKDKALTFIDTPGHEAFQSIRSRGLKTADIIVIIVAGDEGVKPQTVEAIQKAKETTLPIIVAITKIDKEDLVLEKIKSDLAELELLPEEWGGSTVITPLSSTTGEGVDHFLEMVVLVSEIEEIKALSQKDMTDGFILESFLDAKVGPLSSIVIMNGILEVGDVIICGTTSYGKIKRMQDNLGNLIKKAVPGMPVRILGLKTVAVAGDQFRIVKNDSEAEHIIKDNKVVRPNDPVFQTLVEEEKELNLILKADSTGSLEAVEYALSQIVQTDLKINIIAKGVGDITISDIKNAKINRDAIIGFGLKEDPKVKQIAKQQGVGIKNYKLIYELTDEIRDILKKLIEPPIIRNEFGQLKILKVFKEDKKTIILGGIVSNGKLIRGSQIELKSGEELIIKGKLTQLQQNKQDVAEVLMGRECGLMIQTYFNHRTPVEGDLLVSFEEVRQEI